MDTPGRLRRAQRLLRRARPRPLATVDLQPIRLVVFDFDGVMSDNRVWVRQDGVELVACDRSDGLGVGLVQGAGLDTLVLSKQINPVVAARCERLRLPVVHGVDDKRPLLEKLVAERGLDAARTAFVGNDTNDLECLGWVGLGIAVADAHPEILSAADRITRRSGGHGAVREVCDRWLAAHPAGIR